MSGHSKWAGIKHKKAIVDARRGKAFTRITNLITVAAREGGADPEANFRLRLAVEQAKRSNVPGSNIQRAIDRGVGKMDGKVLEEITYEGYGPGGVAVLAKVLTDNRNRSAAEMRSIFGKAGGKLGGAGSVAWMFETRGIIRVEEADSEKREEFTLVAIEAGADDVDEEENRLTIYAAPGGVKAVEEALRAAGSAPESEVALEPKESMEVSDEAVVRQILRLLDVLEESDEVVEVASNFDTSLELEGVE